MGRTIRNNINKKNMRFANKRSEDYKTRAELKKDRQKLKNNTMEEKILVGFFDDIRKEGSSHELIKGSRLVGTYSTEPIYTMYDLGVKECILQKNGQSSIKVEIWELSKEIFKKVEKNYCRHDHMAEKDQIYYRNLVDSPFGEIFIYTYDDQFLDLTKVVENGDWIEYLSYKEVFNCGC